MSKVKEQLDEHSPSAEFQEIEKTDLFAALTNPKFLRGLRTVARHTKKEGIEGGLAVYKSKRGLSVSAPLVPSPQELRNAPQMMSAYDNMRRGYTTINLMPLSRDEKMEIRDDLLLLVHSHPIMNRRLDEALCPSIADIESFEGYGLKVPNLVAGILVAGPEATDLMLYKKSPNRDYMQYYKRYGTEPAVNTFLSTLHEGGINTTTLRLSKTVDDSYKKQVAQAISALEA